MATTLTNSHSIFQPVFGDDANSTIPAKDWGDQYPIINSKLIPVVLAGCLVSPTVNIPTNAIPDYSFFSHYSQIGQQNEIVFEKNIIETIVSYLNYPSNWDGYNGKPPTVDAVNDTLSFIHKLPFGVAESRPGLSGDGEISLFWENDDIFVDIGFVGDGKYSFYARDSQSIEYFKDEINLKDSLPEALINLISIR